MSDAIRIRNLAVFARHGVLDAEAALGQRFQIDVCVTLDLRAAGAADAVAETVDYGALTAVATEAFAPRRKLIEAAAHAAAKAVLVRFPRVETVALTVRKPAAPVEAIFDSMEVSILRGRDDR